MHNSNHDAPRSVLHKLHLRAVLSKGNSWIYEKIMSKFSINPDVIHEARRVNPRGLLEQAYGRVDAYAGGRSLSVRKVLRCDQKSDGTWISCDWYSNAIGDNISLVRHVTGGTFRDAVERLVGPISDEPVAEFRVRAHPVPAPRQGPEHPEKLPPTFGRRDAEEWLHKVRGISMETITEAFDKGAIRPAATGVVFLGYDREQKIRYAAVRYYRPRYLRKDEMGNKQDIKGSSKTYPMMLSGDADDICVVEGGVNVLAVRDLLRDEGRHPLILLSGGVGVRAYFEHNEILRELVRTARQVTLYYENETALTPELAAKKQRETDKVRTRVIEELTELRGGVAPLTIYPPQGYGDVADWNKALREGRMQQPPEKEPLPLTASVEPEQSRPSLNRPSPDQAAFRMKA